MGNYVTLTNVKDALGITGSGDDTFLNLAIDSVEELIDDLCGRSFTQDGSATAKTFRAQPYYAVVDDISTLTGLVIKTDTSADGTFDTTWATSDYQVEPLNNLAASRPVWNLRAIGDNTFPVYGDGQVSLEVTARWGWPAVPSAIQQVALMLSTRYYSRKASPLGVIGMGDFGPVRISRYDSDVTQMLSDYRLPAVA